MWSEGAEEARPGAGFSALESRETLSTCACQWERAIEMHKSAGIGTGPHHVIAVIGHQKQDYTPAQDEDN